MDLNCPKCSSDNTQRISSIVEAGTTTTKGRTTSVGSAYGSGGLGVGSSVGSINATSKTALAEKLARPAKKPVISLYIAIVAIAWFTLAGVTAVGYWILLIAAPLSWFVFSMAGKNKIHNREVFPELISSWENGFYCHRCDTSFVPK